MRKIWVVACLIAAISISAVWITFLPGSIYNAAFRGDSARIAEILKENPELVNTLDKAELTPLHYAAIYGHVDAAKVLLAHGADVEAKRSGGFTALHDAIVKNQKTVAKLLIDHGAKIHGEMSMAYVDKETVQLLLDLGADVNQRNKNGKSPLDEAAFRGNVDVIKLLLEHGVDINARSEYGSTALHNAASRGEAEAAKLLIENGAKVDYKARNGDTPLCRAIRSGQLKVAEILLTNGADVHVRISGHTLLHEAASQPKPWKRPRWTLMPIPGGEVEPNDPAGLVGLLIANGADVNAKNGELKTPLHEAVTDGTLEVAELLLKHGADINAKDEVGSTPLHEAIKWDNLEMVEFLLENGADTKAKSNWGTPLRLAKGIHNQNIIELLNKYSESE